MIILPNELVKVGVKATDTKTSVVEDFSRGWHDWYGRRDQHGGHMTTYKIKDPKWRGSDGESLCLEVKSAADTKLEFSFYHNKWGAFSNGPAGAHHATKEIKGSPDWQTISVGVEDLRPDSDQLPATPAHHWQWICDVTLNGRIDGIRRIYWAKTVARSPSPHLRPATNVPTASTKDQKIDMPELRGQSEEFKAAVRNSLELEKRNGQR